MTNYYVQETTAVQTTDGITHDTRLTSAEIASLWNTYMVSSMVSCVDRHFNERVEDNDTKNVLEDALGIANKRVSRVMEIFDEENLPIPIGFSDEDLDIQAPRLYSDNYYLYYVLNMLGIVLPLNTLNQVLSARSDVREFYTECNQASIRLHKKVSDTLLKKGLFIRSPYIEVTKKVDFVKKQNFLTGFLGEKRPLLAQEISMLAHGININYLGKYLLMGFKQTARSEQVREYITRGITTASKIIDTFSSFLKQEDVPIATYWDNMVTDSTVPPFSDKLIMFHLVMLNSGGTLIYGSSLTNSFRHDLTAGLAGITASVINYFEDGVNIMIDNGWMEEPPRMVDRRGLVNITEH
jgi:hypothetical protein